MPAERLTAEDQLMLWPDEIWPQENGALAVLDGSSLVEAGGRFRIEAVRDVIAARLHLVPRSGSSSTYPARAGPAIVGGCPHVRSQRPRTGCPASSPR